MVFLPRNDISSLIITATCHSNEKITVKQQQRFINPISSHGTKSSPTLHFLFLLQEYISLDMKVTIEKTVTMIISFGI